MSLKKFGEGEVTGVDQDDDQGIHVQGAQDTWTDKDTDGLARENTRADGGEEPQE